MGVPAKRPWITWAPAVLAVLLAVAAGFWVRYDNDTLIRDALSRRPNTFVTVHPGGRVKVSYALYGIGSWGVLDFGPLRFAFPDQHVPGRSSGTMMLFVPGKDTGRSEGTSGWGSRRFRHVYENGVLTLTCFDTVFTFEKGVLSKDGITLDLKTVGPTRIDFDEDGNIVRVRPL